MSAVDMITITNTIAGSRSVAFLWMTALLPGKPTKRNSALAACRCIAKAAFQGLLLSDCHFFNFGVVVTRNVMMHHVVIIDAGSRGTSTGASEHGYRKAEVNKCMANLWTWAAQETQGSVRSCAQSVGSRRKWLAVQLAGHGYASA